jgi:hypothetical protein
LSRTAAADTRSRDRAREALAESAQLLEQLGRLLHLEVDSQHRDAGYLLRGEIDASALWTGQPDPVTVLAPAW